MLVAGIQTGCLNHACALSVRNSPYAVAIVGGVSDADVLVNRAIGVGDASYNGDRVW